LSIRHSRPRNPAKRSITIARYTPPSPGSKQKRFSDYWGMRLSGYNRLGIQLLGLHRVGGSPTNKFMCSFPYDSAIMIATIRPRLASDAGYK